MKFFVEIHCDFFAHFVDVGVTICLKRIFNKILVDCRKLIEKFMCHLEQFHTLHMIAIHLFQYQRLFHLNEGTSMRIFISNRGRLLL